MTSPRASFAEDRGAAAVEFALVLPLLLVVVFGLVDFGRAYSMQISLTQAAREGVRVAALGGSAADATTRTTNAAAPVNGITVGVTTCPAVVTPTSDAQVIASRTYNYITPIQPLFTLMGQPGLAAPVITGRGRMRCNG